MADRKKSSQACLLNLLLGPIVCGCPTRIHLPRVSSFFSTCKLHTFPLESQTHDHPPLLKMAYKPQLPNGSLSLIAYGTSIRAFINFGHFLLLICLMLLWLLAQIEELRRWGKSYCLFRHIITSDCYLFTH